MRRSWIFLVLWLAGAMGTLRAEPSDPRWEVRAEGASPSAREAAVEAARSVLPAKGAPPAERLLSAASAALVRAGWGAGEVSVRLDSLESPPVCVLDLRDLRPARLGDWSWEGTEGFEVPPGEWMPRRRERQIEERLSAIVEQGYPFASIQVSEAGSGPAGMRVRARLDPGPKFLLAGVHVEGAGGTRPSLLERISGLRREEPLQPRLAEEGRDRLARTGLFRSVEGPWLRIEGNGRGGIVYRVDPLPQNRAEGAVGYDGQRRTLSGFVHVELGNLFGTLRRLRASWERFDRDRSRLDLGYREPYLLGLPLAVELALSQEIEDSTWTDDDARGLLEGEIGRGLRARLGLAGHRTVFSGESPSRTQRVSTILGLAADRTGDAGTRGWRFDLEVERGTLERSPRVRAGEGSLTRVSLTAERNLAIGRLGQVRLEGQGGWLEGPDSLPRPEALGLGGGGSLRGHAEQAFRVLRFGLARIEAGVRLLPEGNRAYGFFDAALFRPWPTGGRREKGAWGVGVRVLGGGGWARLDYGVPAGSDPLSGRLHFRLETRF